MWRRIAILIAMMLPAEDTGGAERQETSLLAKSTWVRIDVVLGRLHANQMNAGRGRRISPTSVNTPLESLLISPPRRNGIARIQYSRIAGQQRFQIDIHDLDKVTASQSPLLGASGASVQFDQQPGRPVRLEVTDAGKSQHFEHHSIWHLLLAEPEIAERYLLPILELMRADWHPNETAKVVEAELLLMADRNVPIEQQRFRDLIQQLDSPNFSQRRAADRELANVGIELLPYLQQLERRSLSAEQRMRVQQLEARLHLTGADSPLRVATWLVNDPLYWLSAMDDEAPDKRAVALNRLVRLRNEPIQFNPAGQEPNRRRQLAQLRETLKLR